MKTWRLDDGGQTLVLAARRERLPEVVYWGAILPAGENLETLRAAHAIDLTGGMLDENPDLSLCPEASRTFPGQPGLIVRSENGTPLLPKFCFLSAENGSNLTLKYRDEDNGLTLTFSFETDPETNIIRAKTILNADAPVHLHWLAAPVMPAPQQSDEMIDFSGRWCREFETNHTPWSPGIRYRENLHGAHGA